jgi:hypothetical protein
MQKLTETLDRRYPNRAGFLSPNLNIFTTFITFLTMEEDEFEPLPDNLAGYISRSGIRQIIKVIPNLAPFHAKVNSWVDEFCGSTTVPSIIVRKRLKILAAKDPV